MEKINRIFVFVYWFGTCAKITIPINNYVSILINLNSDQTFQKLVKNSPAIVGIRVVFSEINVRDSFCWQSEINKTTQIRLLLWNQINQSGYEFRCKCDYQSLKNVIVFRDCSKAEFSGILTFVITPIFEIVFNIDSHIPILRDFLARGRFIDTKNLLASIRISRILLKNANKGPSGNATTNNVMKPNWMTKMKINVEMFISLWR